MQNNKNWGGKRNSAGRKKTCLNKVSFNRRLNESVLNILRKYAKEYEITETEALERAILLQANIDKQKGGKIMKIAIPSAEGKLCAHFGHCEIFTFVEINPETKEILSIETASPEEGISCQSASWLAQQGTNIVLAGGMGGRPMMLLAQNGVQVVSGCPELEIRELVTAFMEQSLVTGENSCGHGNHSCHGHAEGHHQCGGHH